jgi:uncharacterized membrane protein YeaQ/YmgE (transglycosylase-associated protein family)
VVVGSLPHLILQRNNFLHAMQQAQALLTGSAGTLMVIVTQHRLRSVVSAMKPWPEPGQGTGRTMDVQSIIIWLVVGAIAGWLAGMVMKGGGFGLIGDIIVGIIGALIAGWLLPQIGIVIGGGFIGAVIDAFIGAVILLFIIKLVKR